MVPQMVENLPAMPETQVRSLGKEDILEKGMAIQSRILVWRIPVFLSGEFHGHRRLVGYSPLGRKESDTTERLTLHY